jgi:hypothetical protein
MITLQEKQQDSTSLELEASYVYAHLLAFS